MTKGGIKCKFFDDLKFGRMNAWIQREWMRSEEGSEDVGGGDDGLIPGYHPGRKLRRAAHK